MWRATDRIAGRNVAAAQFDGVHADGICQLVHRAFDRECAWRLSRPAHEAVRQQIKIDIMLDDVEAFASVEGSPGKGEPFIADAVQRFDAVAMVKQRLELAVRIRSQRHPLLRLRSPADQPLHIGARESDAHGTIGELRSSHAENLVVPQALGAKAAAHIGRADLNIAFLQSEYLRERTGSAVDHLGRVVNDQLAVLPDDRGGVRLDRIMVFPWRRVDGVDLERRFRELLGGVALVEPVLFDKHRFRRIGAGLAFLEPCARRRGVVTHADQCRRMVGLFTGSGQNHRHDLAIPA